MTSLTASKSASVEVARPGTTGLVKLDAKGRARTAREQRELILDEFERSSLSGAEFARLVGVRYSTFAGWVHRRREKRRAKGGKTTGPGLRLVEAVADAAPGGRSITESVVVIHLPGGIRMEVCSATQAPVVAALMQVLQPRAAGC
jgi:hypothetical protein